MYEPINDVIKYTTVIVVSHNVHLSYRPGPIRLATRVENREVGVENDNAVSYRIHIVV